MEIRDDEMKKLLGGLRKGDTGGCPDAEELAGYLENRLDQPATKRIAAHAIACERCSLAISAAGSEVPGKVRVPVAARKKAGELAPSGESAWEIAVRLVEGVIEVVRNTGDETRFFAPVMAGARGGSAAKGTLVAFNRKFAGIDAEIEIENVSNGFAELKVSAKREETGAHARDLRANLYRDGEELMSYSLAGGYAIFDKLNYGTYTMDLTRRGVKLGEIRIEIKGE